MILAFSGFKSSGKTTAAQVVKDAFPNVKEITLAKKLKDVCAKVFEFDRKSLEDMYLKEQELDPPVFLDRDIIHQILKEYQVDFDYFKCAYNYDQHVRPHVGAILASRRKILQYVGTDILKNIDTEVHCQVAAKDIISSDLLYVVTDLRFPDEFTFFKTRYGNDFKSYYINNNKAARVASFDTHSSERLILETAKNCETIENNESLMEFELKVKKTIQEFLNDRTRK